jgi:hypothetical protein
MWGASREGAVGPLGGGASGLYEGSIYFERNVSARRNIYFGRHFAWSKSFIYRLQLVSTSTGSEL